MTVEVIAAPPSPLSIFSRALWSVTKRKREPRLPNQALVLDRAVTDPAELRAYSEVCGFKSGPYLPLLWPHIQAFPLRMALMGGPQFPFPLLGLVHLSNHTEQLRPIRVDETLRLECSFGGLASHGKGIVFDMLTEARSQGDVVWRDQSTTLFRTRAKLAGVPAEKADQDAPVDQPDASQRWRLGADLGRRYARVSGDYNPIHLHPVSARAFGFPRAIAHGMFGAAHALATLPSYDPGVALRYTVWFKLPVLLPTEAVCRQQALADGHRFEVRDGRDEKPFLRGRLSRG